MGAQKRKIFSYSSYPLLWLIYLISYLPMPVLYIISDGAYFFIYKILKYRVLVTRSNLQNAFPEKTESELLQIEHLFYKHLADVMVETVKSFTISEKELKKRMRLLNPEVLEEFYQSGRSAIAVTGHFGNWEWAAITLPFQSKYLPQGVYLPIKDAVFNDAMIKSRSRFGIDLLHAGKMTAEMESRKAVKSITGFIADQSPSNPDRGLWLKFLNQNTCVARGAEKYAVKYEMAVAFGIIKKVKRGYYTLEYRIVTQNAGKTEDAEITRIQTGILEEIIREQPQYWLWSHKRWKHKLPEHQNVYLSNNDAE
jgi:Kdo2-lipid IVA lauroyltransferase/acyltransferase